MSHEHKWISLVRALRNWVHVRTQAESTFLVLIKEELNVPIVDALVFLSCDSRCVLFINGSYIITFLRVCSSVLAEYSCPVYDTVLWDEQLATKQTIPQVLHLKIAVRTSNVAKY
jgi:hypothetical protein